MNKNRKNESTKINLVNHLNSEIIFRNKLNFSCKRLRRLKRNGRRTIVLSLIYSSSIMVKKINLS